MGEDMVLVLHKSRDGICSHRLHEWQALRCDKKATAACLEGKLICWSSPVNTTVVKVATQTDGHMKLRYTADGSKEIKSLFMHKTCKHGIGTLTELDATTGLWGLACVEKPAVWHSMRDMHALAPRTATWLYVVLPSGVVTQRGSQ